MRGTALVWLWLLTATTPAAAQTYQWTDNNGVVNFVDDPRLIPERYRSRVRVREDITTRNPKIRQELREQERRLRQQEQSAPGGALSEEEQPGARQAPSPVPQPRLEPSRNDTTNDSLPPGRTKSQRIRDNIERRQLEQQ